MKLHTKDLQIELTPHRQVDDEQWAQVLVSVQAGKFSGNFVTWLELSNLAAFEQEIRNMQKWLAPPASATLHSQEPCIYIELTFNNRGKVTGRYTFETLSDDGVPTVLSGQFEMDRTCLISLEHDARDLVSKLREHRVT